MGKKTKKKFESISQLNTSKLLSLSSQQTTSNTSNDIHIEMDDSSKNIKIKFKKSKNIPIKKGKWSPQEDKLLEDWVKEHGPKDWKHCSLFIQGRNGKQCKEHWQNCLNPSLIKGEWTPEEDFLIMFFYKKCNGSWKKIIPLFDGRIENSIKNRFYTKLRKYATKNMTPHDRKRLGMKIKLPILKNYIDEALINARAVFLYKSKMSEEEFNLFIENNNRKIKSNKSNKFIEGDNDNLERNYSINFDVINDTELNNTFINNKRFRTEHVPNINTNEYYSQNLNNDFCNDTNNLNNKDNNDINDINDNIIFSIIENKNSDEQSIGCLEYKYYINSNSFINMYKKNNI